MIVRLMRLSAGLCVAIGLGYIILRPILPLRLPGSNKEEPYGSPRVEILGLSFTTGLVVLMAAMLVLSGLRVRFSLLAIMPAGLAVAILAASLIRCSPRRAFSAPPAHRLPRFRCTELVPHKIVVILLVAAIAVVFAGSFKEPILEQDPVAAWSFFAKIFFYERQVFPECLTSGACGPFISHWPPLFPLIQTWGHLSLGSYDDRLIKLLFPVTYLAMLAVVYGALRRLVSGRHSLAMVTMLATLPILVAPFPSGSVASAHIDVPLALFAAATTGMLLWWVASGCTRPILLAGFFAAAGLWVKREGMAFSPVSTVAVWLVWLASTRRSVPRRIAQPLAYTLIQAASMLLLWSYKSNLPGSYTGEPLVLGRFSSPVAAGRFLAFVKGFMLEAADVRIWGFLWILLTILILLRVRALKIPVITLPLLLLVGQITVAVAYMSISDYSVFHHLTLDIRRVLINITPIAAIAVGLLSSVKVQPPD